MTSGSDVLEVLLPLHFPAFFFLFADDEAEKGCVLLKVTQLVKCRDSTKIQVQCFSNDEFKLNFHAPGSQPFQFQSSLIFGSLWWERDAVNHLGKWQHQILLLDQERGHRRKSQNLISSVSLRVLC